MLGLRLGEFRAHTKGCIYVGVSTLTGVCPLVGKVCVRIKLGAGFGIGPWVGARMDVGARIRVGIQLGTKAMGGAGRSWGRV